MRQADGTYHQVTFACEGADLGYLQRAPTRPPADEELLVEGVVNADNFR